MIFLFNGDNKMRFTMIITYILACTLGIITAGCSSLPFTKNDNRMVEVPATKVPQEIPEWFLAKEDENGPDLIATATGVSKDMQFAIDKATLDAKLQLAEKLGTKVDSLTRESALETGFGVKDVNREIDRVSKVRVNQKLNFFRREHIIVTRDKDSYRAYVMLKISKEEGRRLTQVSTSNSREERLRELDKE